MLLNVLNIVEQWGSVQDAADDVMSTKLAKIYIYI